MSKKTLQGFIKTRHFTERQHERGVKDREVAKAIQEGELVETEQGHHFSLGSLKVTVNIYQEVLVTVHPGDPVRCTKKILSRDEARRIIRLIEESQKQKQKQKQKREASDTADDFLAYVQAAGVKKR